jgi:uncharacterized protein YecT (DUF1311 family)
MPDASFNCSKAAGVDERVICSDPLLRQADGNLLVSYRAARLAGKNPAHRAMLKDDEHSWILRRNNECQITKYTVVTTANRPGFVDCLLDQYAERIADLRQMALHPATDPAAISNPIRRSFLAAKVPVVLPTDISLANFQLPPGVQAAALAWRPDDTLVTLGSETNGDAALFNWRQGRLEKIGDMTKDSAMTAFCALASGSAAPPCAAGHTEIEAADSTGDTLQLGPIQTGVTPSPRFVTLITPSGTQTVSPPIRIDSRFHLTANYAPFAGEFIISKSNDPAILDYPTVRRWSKNNCFAYWTVTPKDAVATQACIPFGPYETAVPVPLVAKPAVYFSAAGFGLYRIHGGAAQPVIAGSFLQATVSPDGCSIALLVQNGAGTPPPGGEAVQLGSGTVTVLSVCGKSPG